MPFPERIRREEKLAAFTCAACNKKFSSPDEGELHSKTGLHLVKDKRSKKSRFKVTSAPEGHSILKGKTISRASFISHEDKDNDSVCLCKNCHTEVHRLALAEAKTRGNFPGNATPPQILEEVTQGFIEKRRQTVDPMPKIELAKIHLPMPELTKIV
ncbi:MAG: hypothetical protein HYV90_00700 [Candidatus Woesebacteria bacterium]|nr:MAG: hypothetical protein HYV90_00700 [Candidatus Woesebacteria bacterium]